MATAYGSAVKLLSVRTVVTTLHIPVAQLLRRPCVTRLIPIAPANIDGTILAALVGMSTSRPQGQDAPTVTALVLIPRVVALAEATAFIIVVTTGAQGHMDIGRKAPVVPPILVPPSSSTPSPVCDGTVGFSTFWRHRRRSLQAPPTTAHTTEKGCPLVSVVLFPTTELEARTTVVGRPLSARLPPHGNGRIGLLPHGRIVLLYAMFRTQ